MTELGPGLPDGVIELAGELWQQAGTGTGTGTGVSPGQRAWLEDLLSAPLRLGDNWPVPSAPIEAGTGWVHVEVIDEDLELLAALQSDHGQHGPELLAARCQELRLPVSPYRRLAHTEVTSGCLDAPSVSASPSPVLPSARPSSSVSETMAAVGSARVVDLSTHWAGPLVGKLLAEAGATVIKVDPDARPDGFRSHPRLYEHLNGGKEIVDVDLRDSDHRAQFERLLEKTDLVIESFSRRVLPNLGYSPNLLWTLGSRLSLLSIKAFPLGSAEQNWLAFGPGVHACSGLGLGQTPVPPSVAYPDMLTGLAGFAQAVELLTDRHRHQHREVTLRGSIEPLVQSAANRAARNESRFRL